MFDATEVVINRNRLQSTVGLQVNGGIHGDAWFIDRLRISNLTNEMRIISLQRKHPFT